MLCMKLFRSSDSTLKILDILNGIVLSPKSFHIKNGLNGRIAFTTTFRHGKTVMVCHYYTSSEIFNHILMTRYQECVDHPSSKYFRIHVHNIPKESF